MYTVGGAIGHNHSKTTSIKFHVEKANRAEVSISDKIKQEEKEKKFNREKKQDNETSNFK